MVGALDHVQIVLDDDHGVAVADELVERFHQRVDVVEVQTRRRLVENEQRVALPFSAQIVGQFHALVLTARQRGRRLSQLDVAQSHVLQGLEASHDLVLIIGIALVKELDCLVHRHVQHVADGAVAEGHVQRVAREAFAVASLAGERDVGHELHLDGDGAFAFAFLAAPAGRVEREEAGVVAHLLGQLLLSEQLAYLVKGFQVGGRVAARALADGPLVDELDGLQAAQVARETVVAAGSISGLVKLARQGRVEDLAHQGRLARAAHTGDNGHHA